MKKLQQQAENRQIENNFSFLKVLIEVFTCRRSRNIDWGVTVVWIPIDSNAASHIPRDLFFFLQSPPQQQQQEPKITSSFFFVSRLAWPSHNIPQILSTNTNFELLS